MLCKTLKALREQRNLNQTTLAHRVGVTQSYIAQLEAGVDDNPSLDVLKRLARGLKAPLAKLVQCIEPITRESHMLRGIDRNGHHYIAWKVSMGRGEHKRAWVEHRTGAKDWAGTRRYLNVVRTESLKGGPKGNATDFPITSDLSDEQVLEAFVTATCAITGCPLG
jgi:transcriptional regulator with XRE-family HTH domain